MIRPALILAALLPAVASGQAADLLRLTDGELEGRFAGLDANGTLRWEREDSVAPLEFKTDKVRQIVLRGGKPMHPGNDAAHVTLTNGDRLPGRVTALDDTHLTLATPMAGTLVVPRDAVATLAPRPFGGRLIYTGPFSADGWEVFGIDDGQEDDADGQEQEAEDEPSWQHLGAKWYYTGGRDCLRLDAGMPDRALLRFALEWRSQPPLAVALHADFQKPPPRDGDKDAPQRRNLFNHANYFGNAYVLNIRRSYATLHYCSFNEDGEPFSRQIHASATNIRLQDTGRTEFEIRCDRTKGTISLYVNGDFTMQWDVTDRFAEDGDPAKAYAATGGGIGFQVTGGNAPIRISDIIVAEWNGMPDSARSLEADDTDVVLLTNGTDRFSGHVLGLKDGQLEVDGRYARLRVPLDEVAEVHFARSSQREPDETTGRETRVHFQPLGRLSGRPDVSAGGRLQLESPLLGPLDIDLSPAVILEFQAGNRFLNYWDEDL